MRSGQARLLITKQGETPKFSELFGLWSRGERLWIRLTDLPVLGTTHAPWPGCSFLGSELWAGVASHPVLGLLPGAVACHSAPPSSSPTTPLPHSSPPTPSPILLPPTPSLPLPHPSPPYPPSPTHVEGCIPYIFSLPTPSQLPI